MRRRGGTRAALRLDDVVLLFPGQFRETTGRQAESGDRSEVEWDALEAEKQHTTTLLLPGATRPAVRRGGVGVDDNNSGPINRNSIDLASLAVESSFPA